MSLLDASMTDRENGMFIKHFGWKVKHFADTLDFTYNEAICMMIIYYKFCQSSNNKANLMRKEHLTILFEVLFGFKDAMLVSRIIFVISDNPRFITPEAWMHLLSIFMSDNLQVKMKFAFSVYDFSGGGDLNTERVSNAVEKFFIGDDDDLMSELRADMVELIFKKFDVDKDGLIDFQEYEAVVLAQPCLLEFLGQCFPGREYMATIVMCLNFERLLHENLLKSKLPEKHKPSKKKHGDLMSSSSKQLK